MNIQAPKHHFHPCAINYPATTFLDISMIFLYIMQSFFMIYYHFTMFWMCLDIVFHLESTDCLSQVPYLHLCFPGRPKTYLMHCCFKKLEKRRFLEVQGYNNRVLDVDVYVYGFKMPNQPHRVLFRSADRWEFSQFGLHQNPWHH